MSEEKGKFEHSRSPTIDKPVTFGVAQMNVKTLIEEDVKSSIKPSSSSKNQNGEDNENLPFTIESPVLETTLKSILEESSQAYLLYEKRISQIIKSNPFAINDFLVHFPRDNFRIEKIFSETKFSLGKDFLNNLPLFGRKSLEFLLSSKKILKFNYKDFHKIDTEEIEKELNISKFEIDLLLSNENEKKKKKKRKKKVDDDEEEEEEKGIKMKKKYVTTDISSTKKLISTNLVENFSYIYDKFRSKGVLEYDWGGGAEKKICKRNQFKERLNLDRLTFLVHVDSFETRFTQKFGDIEPLFLSLALYDLGLKKKISENFYCDFNDEFLLKVIKGGNICTNSFTTLKNAIFTVDKRSRDIVMVIVLFKVLEGNIDDVCNKYANPQNFKPTEMTKFKKSVLFYLEKYGGLRQTMGYTVLQVFDKHENLILGKDTDDIVIVRTNGNESILKLLTEETTNNRRSFAASKRITTIKGTLKLDVFPLRVKYSSASIGPVLGARIIKIDKKNENEKGKDLLAKELIYFPAEDVGFLDQFHHFLFVYPLNCKISMKKNIVVRVQLRKRRAGIEQLELEDYEEVDHLDEDEIISTSVYGHSSQNILIDSGYTRISIGKRNPEFNDELKIDLPPDVEKEHFLSFTFYSVQISLKSSSQALNLIGTASIDIVNEHGRLVSGKKELEIIKVYESRKDKKKKKEKVQGKFEVRIKPFSSIYPTQKYLAEVFSQPKKNIPKCLIKSFEKDPKYFTKYLPVVFNMLFELLMKTKEEDEFVYSLFHSMIKLVDSISRMYPASALNDFRNEILLNYVTQYFVNPSMCKKKNFYPFQHLTKIWVLILKGKQSHPDKVELSTKYTWFLFEIIAKSVALYMKEKKINMVNDKQFNKCVYNLLIVLASEICSLVSHSQEKLGKQVNNNLALFLRDLFNFIDRGLVMYFIDYYLDLMMKDLFIYTDMYPILKELKLDFLSIISDFEHYVPLSLPKKHKIKKGNIEKRLCDLSYLCGLVIKQIMANFVDKDVYVRKKSFDLIRGILTKHEFDERYDNPASKKRIFGMYFPLILLFLEKFEDYKLICGEKLNRYEMELEESREKVESLESRYAQHMEKLDTVTQKDMRKKLNDLMTKLTKDILVATSMLEVAEKRYTNEKNHVRLEYQRILYSIITILSNMERTVLLEWFSIEEKKKLFKFLLLLHDCVDFFEYRGKKEIEENFSSIFYDRLYDDGIEEEDKTVPDKMSPTISRILTQRIRKGSFKTFKGKKSSGSSFSKSSSFRKFNKTSLDSKKSSLHHKTKTPTKKEDTRKSSLEAKGSSYDKKGSYNKKGSYDKKGSLSNVKSSENLKKKDEILKVDPESIERSIKWEGILSTQVSLVILDILVDLVNKIDMDILLIDRVFEILLLFMNTRQSDLVMSCFFEFLKFFIEYCRSYLFLDNTSYSEKLCSKLLKNCYSCFKNTRSKSTAVLYFLIKNNYLEKGSITRMKTQTSTKLSDLVFEIDERSVELLQESFKVIAEYSKSDTNLGINLARRTTKKSKVISFVDEINSLVNTLSVVLTNTKRINEYRKNPNSEELLVDYFLDLCLTNKDSPEICTTWYKNLSEYQEGKKRYVESAQSICVILGYSYHYLYCKGYKVFSDNALNYKLLEKCSPCLKQTSFDSLYLLFREGENPSFPSIHFTCEGFIDLLNKAMKLFEIAKYYEYSLNLVKLLIQYYEFDHRSDYVSIENEVLKNKRLSKLYKKVSKYYKSIANVISDNRLFGSYYYIAFYGKKLEDNNGKEYVYKFSKICPLRDVIEYCQKLYGFKYKKKYIKIIAGSCEVTEEHYNDKKFVYVKIISIKGVNPNAEEKLECSKSYFAMNTNLRKFLFEIPFTKDGKKSHGKIELQYKRKTFLEVDIPFPSLTRRQLVKKQYEVELSPIENSIEVIQNAVEKLKSFQNLSDKDIDVNSLQLVLSGTVIPQVAVGITAIIDVFLTPKYETDDFLPKLKEKFREFLEFNLMGIHLNEKHLLPSQIELHKEFVKGYKKLFKLISKKVEGCEPFDPDTQEDEI